MREMQLRLCGNLGQPSYLFHGGARSFFELFSFSGRISENGLLVKSVCALGATDLGATIVGGDGIAAGVQTGSPCLL
ncbi:uncharacterized protein LDX57_000997 [Aspergillus melleus]|uniref:uncharacterized protein n=1 Tax=Aspergillus melleus TaxID=138277 RepID=UPI001E8D705C|nr:uncharacterized protein LDX57_000997 [Aspergillus melleus]KAH8423240.1 hypothetical protein LDX57_000997 [Aspergillus melleus]